ncbi:hypothetical protein [Neobacillus vireti]|uniref:hypothetical protein n=1 Tax=Neobacillus vireti TaxID=220686 RepID=UPI002FFE8640
MPQQELEFRGINRKHLEMYFAELGGKQITNLYPITYQTDDWIGEILSEEELTITSTFKVNRVYIRFTANDGEALKEIIKKFRVKTTRIGG